MSKICPKCGKEIPDLKNFCPECGTTLKDSASDSYQRATLFTDNLVVIAIIAFFLIAICLVAIPTKTITNDVEVPYNDTETYYEKEPFDVQQSYQEEVPYQTTETYTDTVPVPVSIPYQDYEYSYQTYDAGTGKYYSTISSGCVCSSTRYMYDKDGVYGALCVQLNCKIATPVTKYRTEMQQQSVQKERPVTKYQSVTKTRTVTQYQDVTKTREVLKTRIEHRPVEVNWLLGFKTPYSLHLPYISG
jgi:hypothetical protein